MNHGNETNASVTFALTGNSCTKEYQLPPLNFFNVNEQHQQQANDQIHELL